MFRWRFGLRWRLALGFTVILALTLGSVALFTGKAVDREVARVQAEQDRVRAGQVVAASQTAGSIRVEVADTGPGIPSEVLPHVFDRLYRVDPSRDRGTGGPGLGLTIARQLVEAHGGVIRAESEEGTGSRFGFDLPTTGY